MVSPMKEDMGSNPASEPISFIKMVFERKKGKKKYLSKCFVFFCFFLKDGLPQNNTSISRKYKVWQKYVRHNS